MSGADHYEVRFFGADLADLATLGPIAEAGVVRAGALPGGLTHGRRVMFEVVATASGERLAVSEPQPLIVP
ncbi:MAG: hypothetical protein IPJ04_14530 [Candidatus Eisenbacteria bacterium]|nr:hypothetical protein [Candidatus Eisenbacteria bacterium]